MLLPELFNIICNYLQAKDIINLLLISKEYEQYITFLSSINIKKILFAEKNYFSVNYKNFSENDEIFSNKKFNKHLIETKNTQLITYLISSYRYVTAYYDFFIFAIFNNNVEIIKQLSDYINPEIVLRHCYEFMHAIKYGYAELIEFLLDDGRLNPSIYNNQAIGVASEYGQLKIVKLLLQDSRVDPSANNNYAIRKASENSHYAIVKLLLNHCDVDPSDNDNYAIRKACKNGKTKIVKLLLKDKRVDPSDVDNYAIKYACEFGRVKTVRVLLKDDRVDAGADDNYAIKNACKNGHLNVVKCLMKNKNVNPYVDNFCAITLLRMRTRMDI